MTIGFGTGIPKEVKEKWAKVTNGITYAFGKDRKSPTHFVYYVQRDTSAGTFTGDVSTGYETDRDLTRAEVEQRQQFIDFMNGSK
jgi:hypothetical protein